MKHVLYVILGTIVLLLSGLIYAWSILSVPLIQEYENWSLSQISLTFTICTFMFCIGGFLRGLVASKVSCKLTLIIAGVLFAGGLFLTATVQQNILSIYLGFGVLCGFSVGLAYNTIMSVVVEWFTNEKGVISGILLMGFGIGSFVIGKAFQLILTNGLMSWREIFCVFGAITGILYLIAGLVIKQPKKQIIESPRLQKKEVGMTAKQMVLNRSFQIYFIWAILLASSGYILLAHANGMLNEAVPSIDVGLAASIVSLISICNGAGRIVWGLVYDKIHYKKTMWLIEIDFALCVISLWIGVQNGNLTLMNIGYIAGGLFFAGLAAMNPACIGDFFGAKYYPINFSIINMNVLISSFGSTLAALMYDKTGTFVSVILMLSVIWVISLLCVMFIRKPRYE